MQVFFEGVVTGLGLGAIYTLVATSYTLILASSGVFNFAQGAVITFGVVGSYVLGARLGIPLFPLLLVLCIGGAIVGWVSEFVAVRPFLRRQGHLTYETLVSTIGLGLVIEALIALFFGSDQYQVVPYVSASPVRVGNVPIEPTYIVIVAVTAVLCLALDLILYKTELGLVMRAMILDREGATLNGINQGRVIVWAFAIAGLFAALAGFLIAPVTGSSAFVGDQIGLYGFVAMAIGGLGSFRGCIAGGLIVGLIVGLTPVYLNPNLTEPIVYLFLIAMFVARPIGLFGSAGHFAGGLRDV